MTNKKFKVAAMSMALTACVAAQPLIANAADEVNTASSNNTPAQASDASAGSGTESNGTGDTGSTGSGTESNGSTGSTGSGSGNGSNQSDGTNMESTEEKKEAFGEHVDVEYNHGQSTTDKETGSTTTPGKVVKNDGTGDQDKTDGDQKNDETDDQGKTDGDQKNDETGDQDKTDGDQKNDETGDQDKTDGDQKNDETGDKKDGTGGEKKLDEVVPPTDSGNTEKNDKDKQIGNATIVETPNSTVTGAPEAKPGAKPVTKTDTTTKDGTTTITETTTIEGTQTTTTTGSGHAKADTEEKTIDTTDISKDFLKKELGNIDWNVEQNDKVGTDEKNPYKVISKEEEPDGNKTKQTLTLEKVEESSGHMTAEDIAKLVDADRDSVNKQEDGSYTLKRTETVTDADGNPVTRTTYITVRKDTDEVSIKTTTTIKVTREKVEHHEKGDKDAFETDTATNFKLPDIYLYDEETRKNIRIIDEKTLNELISKDTQPKSNGNQTIYTVTVVEDGVTCKYEITKDLASSTLTPKEIADRMGDDYEAKDGKVYYIGAGQRVELTVDQTNVIREKLSYTVKVTETTKDKEPVEERKDAAEAEARDEAVRSALTNAVKKMLEEHTITEDEANELNKNIASDTTINAATGGTFKTDITVKGVTKHFELDYSKGTITSTDKTPTPEKNNDQTTDHMDKTANGIAYVFGGKVVQDNSDTAKKEDSTIFTFDEHGKVKAPDAAKGTETYDEKGRLKSYKIGDTTYEFKYGTMKPEEAKAALGDKLNQEGWDLGKFDATITTVSWTEKTTKADDNSAADIYDKGSCTIQQDAENEGKYNISFTGGTSYNGFTKDGNTYTGKSADGKKDVTIIVTDGDELKDTDIEKLIRQQYKDIVGNVTVNGKTATYTGKDGNTHTVSISSAKNQTILVTTVEKSNLYAQPQPDSKGGEASVKKDLCEKLESKLGELEVGQTLQIKGKDGKVATIKKTKAGKYTLTADQQETVYELAEVTTLSQTIVRDYASNQINYDSLSKQDIWELLDIQQQYADGSNNAYAGVNGCDSYWPGSGFENNGERNDDGTHKGEQLYQNETKFSGLGLDANVTIEDATTHEKIDGVLLNDADHKLTFTYGKKEQIAGYVDLSKYPDYKSDGTAYYNKDGQKGSLNKTKEEYHPITGAAQTNFNKTTGTGADAQTEYTVAQSKDGLYWNGSKYEPVSKLTYNVEGGSLAGKNCYQVLGTVAYEQQGGDYTSKATADAALAKLQADNPGKYDKGVVVTYMDGSVAKYRVYGKTSELKAYGYMTASANTSDQQNVGNWYPGQQPYLGAENAGTYELRIQGLKKYGDTVTGSYGVGKALDLSVITENQGSAKHLGVSQTSTTSETDDGSGYYGSYTNTWTKTKNWRKCDGTSDVEGDGHGDYTSFMRWVSRVFHGASGEHTKQGGSFHYEYDYTTVGDLQGEHLTQTVEKHAKVDYDYITEEVRNVKIVDQEVTIITPDGGDDDGGDEIIDEKDSDSPVLPGTPELPPVQDAKPDAPVLPADPVLPAVQDAHALPQTGVNWLAAIGLALSGMTLMITGAFASLLGKNAKH